MAEYIERESLKQSFNYIIHDVTCPMHIAAEIEQILDCAPAADVAEVKRGHWFFTDYDYFDCSECGEAYYNGCESTKEAKHRLETGEVYSYCPYCGAKMKEDENE